MGCFRANDCGGGPGGLPTIDLGEKLGEKRRAKNSNGGILID